MTDCTTLDHQMLVSTKGLPQDYLVLAMFLLSEP